MAHVKEVTSLANPMVKDIRALTSKKDREATGAFLAEGVGFVSDALDRGWAVQTLVYDRAAKGEQHLRRVVDETLRKGGQVLEATEKVLSAITRRDNPQAVIGVFQQRWTALDALRLQPDATLVALDRVRDPGNLGTIIRTADAAGATGVILIDECTDPFALEAVRATMGSLLTLPLTRCSADEFLAWQATAGARVVATHLEGAVDYRTIDYRGKPTVLLMGTEQSGLQDRLAEAADVRARNPAAGQRGIAEPRHRDGCHALRSAPAPAVAVGAARKHAVFPDLHPKSECNASWPRL